MSAIKPNIEEFIKTLTLQDSLYVPNAELGVHPKIKEKFIGRPILNLNDDVDFWYKAGYDYIKLQPDVDFNPAKIGQSDRATFQQDGNLQFKWATEKKGIITTFEEFENYIFPSKNDFNYQKFEDVKKILPEGMGVIGQYGDIFTMTWELMGFEGFSFALFENPDLIRALNKKIGDLVISMFEYFVQSDVVDVIWYSDDIAFTNGLLMSPEVLDEFFFPWLKKIGDLAKEYKKPLIYHTDGILFQVLDKIIECGVNALHPIEPKAMNIKDVKEKYGDKLCLIGHVDVDLLSRGTEEEVRNKVKTNIEIMYGKTGYCAGSGNSIPEYVNFNNYVAMLKAVEEFGRRKI